MLRIAALNESDSSEGSQSQPFVREATKEAKEAEAYTLYHKALDLLRHGDAEQAENVFRDLIDHDFLVEAWEILEERGSEAIHPGLQLLYSIQKNLATMATQRKDYKSALDSYLEAVKIDNTEVTVWYKVGMTALALEDFQLAMLAFEQGLDCNPKHWPCLDRIIPLLYALNNYIECLYYIARAWELEVHYMKGYAFRNKIYTEHVALKTDAAEFFENCDSEIYTVEIDPDEAKEYIDEALKIRKRNQVLCKPPEPKRLKFPPRIKEYSWKHIGEVLVQLYDDASTSDPPMSLGLKMDVPDYSLLPAEEPFVPTTDDSAKINPETDATATNTNAAKRERQSDQSGKTKNPTDQSEQEEMEVDKPESETIDNRTTASEHSQEKCMPTEQMDTDDNNMKMVTEKVTEGPDDLKIDGELELNRRKHGEKYLSKEVVIFNEDKTDRKAMNLIGNEEDTNPAIEHEDDREKVRHHSAENDAKITYCDDKMYIRTDATEQMEVDMENVKQDHEKSVGFLVETSQTEQNSGSSQSGSGTSFSKSASFGFIVSDSKHHKLELDPSGMTDNQMDDVSDSDKVTVFPKSEITEQVSKTVTFEDNPVKDLPSAVELPETPKKESSKSISSPITIDSSSSGSSKPLSSSSCSGASVSPIVLEKTSTSSSSGTSVSPIVLEKPSSSSSSGTSVSPIVLESSSTSSQASPSQAAVSLSGSEVSPVAITVTSPSKLSESDNASCPIVLDSSVMTTSSSISASTSLAITTAVSIHSVSDVSVPSTQTLTSASSSVLKSVSLSSPTLKSEDSKDMDTGTGISSRSANSPILPTSITEESSTPVTCSIVASVTTTGTDTLNESVSQSKLESDAAVISKTVEVTDAREILTNVSSANVPMEVTKQVEDISVTGQSSTSTVTMSTVSSTSTVTMSTVSSSPVSLVPVSSTDASPLRAALTSPLSPSSAASSSSVLPASTTTTLSSTTTTLPRPRSLPSITSVLPTTSSSPRTASRPTSSPFVTPSPRNSPKTVSNSDHGYSRSFTEMPRSPKGQGNLRPGSMILQDVQSGGSLVEIQMDIEDRNAAKKGQKRKRISNTTEEIIMYGKRRSARVRNTGRKKEEETVNFHDLLQAFLPSSIKNVLDEETVSVEMDKDEPETTALENKTDKKDEKQSPVSMVTETWNEADMVKTFLLQCVKNQGLVHTMNLYLHELAKHSRVKWSPGLCEMYMSVFNRVRKHLYMPRVFDDTDPPEVFQELAQICLLWLELQLDQWLIARGPGATLASPRSGLHVLTTDDLPPFYEEDLWFVTVLCDFNEALGPIWANHCIRVYWAKARDAVLKGKMEKAVFCYERTKEYIEYRREEEQIERVCLPNCQLDNLIDIETVSSQQELLQKSQSIEEAQRFYEMGQFDKVVHILLQTFNTDKNKVMKVVSDPGERQSQLVLLQESLFKTGDMEKCLLWGEESIAECYSKYQSCFKPDLRTDWIKTMIQIFTYMQRSLEQGASIVQSLPASKITRLSQNLIRLIDTNMSLPETVTEMTFDTVIPWILLYYIIKQEEEKLEGQRLKDSGGSDELEENLSSSHMLLNIAHDYLGSRCWCTKSDGALLLFFMMVLKEKMDREPAKFLEEYQQAFEQCVYCLFGHPNKKGKAKHLQDHNASTVTLEWKYAVVVFDYFKPPKLPEFDGYKSETILAELEFLFLKKIIPLIPESSKSMGIKLEDIQGYVEGTYNTAPSIKEDRTVTLPVVDEVFYLLADFNLKNKEFMKAIKFYMQDLCYKPDRLDSWAGMALARMSRLDAKLASADLMMDAMLTKTVPALRCFKRAVEIDDSNSKLWIEYGTLAYQLHTHSSWQAKWYPKKWFKKMDEKFIGQVQETRTEMLQIARLCFNMAATCDPDATEDRWLHNYMLGKCGEKSGKSLKEYMPYYFKAMECVHEEYAKYPKKIVFSYTTPNLAVEALEMYYRIHVNILKLLLKQPPDSDFHDYKLYVKYLLEASTLPFVKRIEKGQETRTDRESASSADESSCSGMPTPEKPGKPTLEKSDSDHTYFRQKNNTGANSPIIARESDISKSGGDNSLTPSKSVTTLELHSEEQSSQLDATLTFTECPGLHTQESSKTGETTIPASQTGETTRPTSQTGETTQPTSQTGETTQPTSQTGETTQPTFQARETTVEKLKEETGSAGAVTMETNQDNIPGVSEKEMSSIVEQQTDLPANDNDKIKEENEKMDDQITTKEAMDIEETKTENKHLNVKTEENQSITKSAFSISNILGGTDESVDATKLVHKGSGDGPKANEPKITKVEQTESKSSDSVIVIDDDDEDEKGHGDSGDKSGDKEMLSEVKSVLLHIEDLIESEINKEESEKTGQSNEGAMEVDMESETVKKEMVLDAKLTTDVEMVGRKDDNKEGKEVNTKETTDVEKVTRKDDSKTEMDSIPPVSTDTVAEKAIQDLQKAVEEVDKEKQEMEKGIRLADQINKMLKLPVRSLHRELLDRCRKALLMCLERFPTHYKSHYRLAYLYLNSPYHKDLTKAHNILLGEPNRQQLDYMPERGLFGERKHAKFFQGIWKIPIDEIDRSGSFPAHLNRCIELLLDILKQEKDSLTLHQVHLQLNRQPEPGKKYLRDAEKRYYALLSHQYTLDAVELQVSHMKTVTDSEARLQFLRTVYKIWEHGVTKLVKEEIRTNQLLAEAYRVVVRKLETLPHKMLLVEAKRFCKQMLQKPKIDKSQDSSQSTTQSMMVAQRKIPTASTLASNIPTTTIQPPKLINLENIMKSQVTNGSMLKGMQSVKVDQSNYGAINIGQSKQNASANEKTVSDEGGDSSDVIMLSDCSIDSPVKAKPDVPLFKSSQSKEPPPSSASQSTSAFTNPVIISSQQQAMNAPTVKIKMGLLQAVKRLKPVVAEGKDQLPSVSGDNETSMDDAMSSAVSEDESEAPLPSTTENEERDKSSSSSSASSSSDEESSSSSSEDDSSDDDSDDNDDGDDEDEQSQTDEPAKKSEQRKEQPKLKMKKIVTSEDEEESSDNPEEIDLVSSDDEEKDDDKDKDYNASEDAADDDVIMISDDEFIPKGKAIIPSPPHENREQGMEVLVRDVPSFDPMMMMSADLDPVPIGEPVPNTSGYSKMIVDK